jgi:2-methylisocitrate lyase-like PEP mutase family enzyme
MLHAAKYRMPPSLPTIAKGHTMILDIPARRTDFKALHEDGYFLLPTAWDVGTAKRLEAMGFAGLASSRTSLAWVLGRDDGRVTRDQVLAHLRELVDATEMAVHADFGSGFAEDPAEVMANVRLAINTGIASLSITDRAGLELEASECVVRRIHAGRDVIATSGADVLLVGRSEGLLTGHASIDDTIRRLVAYSEAGADVLCAPGASDPNVIRMLVQAVSPKAVDVQLMKPGMTAAQLGELGVRRISVGDTFAEASWGMFSQVAQHFIDFGSLSLDNEIIGPSS